MLRIDSADLLRVKELAIGGCRGQLLLSKGGKGQQKILLAKASLVVEVNLESVGPQVWVAGAGARQDAVATNIVKAGSCTASSDTDQICEAEVLCSGEAETLVCHIEDG